MAGALAGTRLAPARAAQQNATAIDRSVRDVLGDRRADGLRRLIALGDHGAVAPLIQALYWLGAEATADIEAALASLTGASVHGWFEWMVWQQNHPEIVPYAGYDSFLSDLLAQVDPKFRRFVNAGMAHDIRLEEIVWGGVSVDGIPALDRPRLIAASDAGYLNDDDRVFGVEIDGDVRAYPLRIADWHEMVNDVIGGVPVSLAYCTLCGAGILFAGRVVGRREPFTFGSSGLLYRSNKLMYDRATDSLWNQFTGKPVTGKLVGSDITLAVLPVTIEPWAAWRRRHPTTSVLSLDTGHIRDYAPGAAYNSYFASDKLMFPAAVRDASKQKDLAFGVRVPGGVRAYPLERFSGGAVINDHIGFVDIVLFGEGRTVRAYESGGHRFEASDADTLRSGGTLWRVSEAALLGPNGTTLPRIPGHVAYRFAWEGYFGTGVDASTPPLAPKK